MTNLTEQWKRGELPEGWYYVKDEDGQIIIAEYFAYCIDKETNEAEYDWSCCSEPEQVVGRVSSYEQWQAKLEENTKLKTENKWYSEQHNEAVKEVGQLKKWCEEFNALDVAKENTKLKDLLKECKHIMSIEKDFASCHFEKDKLCKLLTKINQVLGEE